MTKRNGIIGLSTALFVVGAAGCGGQGEAGEETFGHDQAAVGPAYAGMDSKYYPGDAAMSWLRANTDLRWAGYYLGPAPDHLDTSWMPTRSKLAGMGWGFAPIYLGQQAGWSTLSVTQGSTDGHAAAALASNAGFPSGTVIYLDVEEPSHIDANLVQYYQGWVSGVVSAGYSPGVYTSYQTATQLTQADSRPTVWTWDINVYPCPSVGVTSFPTPSPSGAWSGATDWQLAQNCSITTGGRTSITADLNSSSLPDPSIPAAPGLSTPLSPINNVSITGTYVPLSWRAAPLATYFEVFMYYWNGSSYVYDGELTTTQPSLNVGLSKGWYYKWIVVGCDAGGCSSTSTPGTFYYH